MSARFWLHINHPNNYTRIHAEAGCKRSREASEGKLAGRPYGPVLGDRNGAWEGPFSSRSDVDAAAKRADKATNGDCSFCFGRD